MKTLLIILAIALTSCGGKQEMTAEEANDIIRQSKEHYSSDSLRIDRDMQIQEARIRLEHATGKKDTLSNAEWLKKAEEDFK